MQKSFRNLLISIGKSFLRLLIESHKTGQIIGELRFFRAEPRFFAERMPCLPTIDTGFSKDISIINPKGEAFLKNQM